MDVPNLAIIAGIWLSLLYSAAVMPASVWVIQVTVSRGWIAGGTAATGLSLGQFPWCLAASLILFRTPAFWQSIDLPLRLLAVAFLLWMASRCLRCGEVQHLKTESPASLGLLFQTSCIRSLLMPWRLPLWSAFILSIGIHLRGPGAEPAIFFALGAVIGQLLWHGHFILVAGLFGNRVPEPISLRSLNKLRLLATTVNGGLALVILAPVAFPPA
jgi:threonine/homoserine/homoserine lactone efflux protein